MLRKTSGRAGLTVVAGLLLAVATGCTTPGLNQGRSAFYQRDLESARDAMAEAPGRPGNLVLFLMERGMVKHVSGRYADASVDWNDAAAAIEALDYYSVSRGTASLVINERTKAFRGAPYEQALLHAFNAKNYFARQDWDGAAVEARILVDRLSELNGFPDDPYSRYVAATAFALIGSHDSAAIEFAKADALTDHLTIDHRTGAISAGTNVPPATARSELVCFISLGGAPSESGRARGAGRWGPHPYVDIEINGKLAGRSHTLSRTTELLRETDARLAGLRTAKTVGRIVVKEGIAYTIWRENPLLGELTRLVLYLAEIPDTRRWETLPLHLQVARVPCPPGVSEFTAVFRDSGGREVARHQVTHPLTRRGQTAVSFLREL